MSAKQHEKALEHSVVIKVRRADNPWDLTLAVDPIELNAAIVKIVNSVPESVRSTVRMEMSIKALEDGVLYPDGFRRLRELKVQAIEIKGFRSLTDDEIEAVATAEKARVAAYQLQRKNEAEAIMAKGVGKYPVELEGFAGQSTEHQPS